MVLREIVSTQQQDTRSDADLILDSLMGLLGIREKRKFVLTSENETLTLPVTPWKYQIQTGQLNKTYDILDFGEALVFGNVKLKKLKFSCFFPALHHGYPFIVGDRLEPAACIDRLTKWKEAKSPVRVIITDSPVNLMMAIMELDYKEKDGTRDIEYSLSLTEYRDLNVPAANNEREIDTQTGLRGRPDSEPSKYKTEDWLLKRSDDIVEVFKRLTGSTVNFDSFMNNNNFNLSLPPEVLRGDVLIY